MLLDIIDDVDETPHMDSSNGGIIGFGYIGVTLYYILNDDLAIEGSKLEVDIVGWTPNMY